MKNRIHGIALAGALFACMAPGAADALSLVGAPVGPGTVTIDFSTPETVAVDIAFTSPGTIVLTYQLDAADVNRGIAGFNSVIDNLSGAAFAWLQVDAGAVGLLVGSAVSNDGGVSLTAPGPGSVRLDFGPAMTTQAYLGDPLFTGTASDWTLSLAGLGAGDQFELAVTAAVPEPGTWGMAATGLALIAAFARRRRRAVV